MPSSTVHLRTNAASRQTAVVAQRFSLEIALPLSKCARLSFFGRNPAPATYTTDSETPSSPSAFSIFESANAIVQKGAMPSHVDVKQNVWHKCPASIKTAPQHHT